MAANIFFLGMLASAAVIGLFIISVIVRGAIDTWKNGHGSRLGRVFRILFGLLLFSLIPLMYVGVAKQNEFAIAALIIFGILMAWGARRSSVDGMRGSGDE